MMKAEEVKIKAPWGHIAGKIWGDRSKPIALLFHGLGDNASSFNRLIPHLPQRYRYASIDLPGHGFSSHFPPHVPLHMNLYLIAYRIVCRYFEQERYVFIAHSFGAQLVLLFAQLYPELVEKIVVLDAVYSHVLPTTLYKKYSVRVIERFLDLEAKLESAGGRPTYTYDQAFDKLLNNRMVSDITVDTAKALMERSVLPTPDGQRYYFTSDPRHKIVIPPTKDVRYALETLDHDPLKCRILIVLANGNVAQQDHFRQILQAFEKFENITIVKVEGLHDVHSDHPERVAPFIVDFLNEGVNKAKL